MLRKANYLFFLLWIATSTIALGQQTQGLQHIWEVDPPFGNIWDERQRNRSIRFDIELLKSRFAKDRLDVAQRISLEHSNPNFHHHQRAMELLIEGLQSGEENLQVRRAMVAAALSLADASHAEVLWSLAKSDSAILPAIERKLVQWKSSVAIQDWRQRLIETNAEPTELATALEGLAGVGNADDRSAIQGVLLASHTSATNKYHAACALGTLVTEGLNELAQQILASDLNHRYLLAAQLLKRHSGDNTAIQMRQILNEGSPSAQLVAYRSMSTNAPDVSREFAKQMTSHSDAGLRVMALELLQTYSDEESLRIQGSLLGDRHPEVRSLVVKHFLKKANQGQRAGVDECVLTHLNSETWTGVEKAIALAVGLQDRSHCKAFVRLLEHPRPEVNMLAGWALMEMADETELLASMLVHAENMTEELKSTEKVTSLTNTDRIRLSYLHEAFGKNRYQPASQMLVKYIPKLGHQFGNVSRASAIWALGQLNKGNDNKALRASLHDRISDFTPINPEDYLVRFTCHLALGEMANLDSVGVILKMKEDLPSPVAYAADWALLQIERASAARPVE